MIGCERDYAWMRARMAAPKPANRPHAKRQRRHGTYSCYNGGCHCDNCRLAARAYHREYDREHPPTRKGGRRMPWPKEDYVRSPKDSVVLMQERVWPYLSTAEARRKFEVYPVNNQRWGRKS